MDSVVCMHGTVQYLYKPLLMVPTCLDCCEDVSLQRATHCVHCADDQCACSMSMCTRWRTCRHIVVRSTHELLKGMTEVGILRSVVVNVCCMHQLLHISYDMNDNLQ